jgi:glycosyltransferase involved in cell wall biosynthesis
MTSSLVMIVKNEERYLSFILPTMRSCFDEIVAVDAESSDATRAILERCGARVFIRQWTDDFAAARNEAIARATGDIIFMLDADEAMFPQDIAKVQALLESEPAVALPRIDFVYDHSHYNPGLWPDWQCRFFRSGQGYRFEGRVHEQLVLGDSSAFVSAHALHFDGVPIYHYGQAKPVPVTWLRHYNYGRIRDGLTSVTAIPQGADVRLHHNIAVYEGSHPLKGIE